MKKFMKWIKSKIISDIDYEIYDTRTESEKELSSMRCVTIIICVNLMIFILFVLLILKTLLK